MTKVSKEFEMVRESMHKSPIVTVLNVTVLVSVCFYVWEYYFGQVWQLYLLSAILVLLTRWVSPIPILVCLADNGSSFIELHRICSAVEPNWWYDYPLVVKFTVGVSVDIMLLLGWCLLIDRILVQIARLYHLRIKPSEVRPAVIASLFAVGIVFVLAMLIPIVGPL